MPKYLFFQDSCWAITLSPVGARPNGALLRSIVDGSAACKKFKKTDVELAAVQGQAVDWGLLDARYSPPPLNQCSRLHRQSELHSPPALPRAVRFHVPFL